MFPQLSGDPTASTGYTSTDSIGSRRAPADVAADAGVVAAAAGGGCLCAGTAARLQGFFIGMASACIVAADGKIELVQPPTAAQKKSGWLW